MRKVSPPRLGSVSGWLAGDGEQPLEGLMCLILRGGRPTGRRRTLWDDLMDG